MRCIPGEDPVNERTSERAAAWANCVYNCVRVFCAIGTTKLIIDASNWYLRAVPIKFPSVGVVPRCATAAAAAAAARLTGERAQPRRLTAGPLVLPPRLLARGARSLFRFPRDRGRIIATAAQRRVLIKSLGRHYVPGNVCLTRFWDFRCARCRRASGETIATTRCNGVVVDQFRLSRAHDGDLTRSSVSNDACPILPRASPATSYVIIKGS